LRSKPGDVEDWGNLRSELEGIKNLVHLRSEPGDGLEANAEMVPRLQFASTCFYASLPI
jgi:hypothetical protein